MLRKYALFAEQSDKRWLRRPKRLKRPSVYTKDKICFSARNGNEPNDKVLGMRGRDLDGSIKIDTLNALLTGAQQLVRAVLNPVGDVGVGRSSVWWIIFKTTVGWRVVRRGDDDAICKTPVVPKNGVRNDRSWVKPSSR